MSQLLFIAVACVLVTLSAACSFTPLPNATTKDGYCASVWASGLQTPRGIWIASNADVLVAEAGKGVSVWWEENGAVQGATITTQTDLNHGITLSNEEDYLYASTPSTVYRWPFKVGNRSPIGVNATIVVSGIPTPYHNTRTLRFDSNGVLHVAVGSGSNVDPNPNRAGVMLFDVDNVPQGGWTWADRKPMVVGTRNEVGIRFDAKGQLWGVENGIDELNRPDLGGDIHDLNPGEEVNLLTQGNFYGYPYCWSQFQLANVTTPEGTQYVHPNFMNRSNYTDAWCQDPNNVVKPMYQMQPHAAPLDILFAPNGLNFSGIATGDAFVTQHGSWDRQPPMGYRVIHLFFQNGMPASEEPLLWYSGSNDQTGQTGPGWHRPVGLGLRTCQGVECLLVSSDATGVIIALTNTPNCQC